MNPIANFIEFTRQKSSKQMRLITKSVFIVFVCVGLMSIAFIGVFDALVTASIIFTGLLTVMWLDLKLDLIEKKY